METIAARFRLFLLGLLAFTLPLFSQAISTRDRVYRIQCSDVLEVVYQYTPEFSQTATVRPDGRITLLGFGDLEAKGRTLDQLTAEVVSLSSKRLKDPQVTVALKEFQKPFVWVEGEVANPGRFELRGDITALDAISLAGGFRDSSKHSQVLLLRKIDNDTAHTKVLDLKKIIASRKLEEAIELRAGDVLFVPKNKLSKIERVVHWGQFGFLYPIR